MRLLTFTSLFPDRTRPRHGIFVETRLRQLVAGGEMQSVVLAPVPWFPWRHSVFGSYAAFARVPREEERNGIRVLHPRYPLIPRLGMSLQPFGMAAAATAAARRLIEHGYDFDAIDAHYFYPDGVAAAMVAERLDKPLVITARGSDINVIPRYYVPRKLIQFAARRAQHIVTVTEALRDKLLALGVNQDKVSVLRNGVDSQLFRPIEREALRVRFGLHGQVLLSVGNLIPLKGHELAVTALSQLPQAVLVIVGEGPEHGSLQSLALRLGVAERVRFVMTVTQEALRDYYNVADVLILASSHEGWPNVLLEAMACGTPVVAARVGGTPEIVRAAEAGRLFGPRTPRALAEAVSSLFAAYPDRAATRRYAQRFGWEQTTSGQTEMFRRVISGYRAAQRA